MIKKIKENLFQFYFREFGSCVYLLKLENKNILIDTSSADNKQELLTNLKELGLNAENIDVILLTHNHWDHNSNLDLFKKAEIYDSKNIEQLNKKTPSIKIIKTPGHSKDSSCFLYKEVLFSGDTIFHNGSRGKTNLPGGSEQEIQKSIEKLKGLNYKILCPGHIN